MDDAPQAHHHSFEEKDKCRRKKKNQYYFQGAWNGEGALRLIGRWAGPYILQMTSMQLRKRFMNPEK